MRFGKIRTVGLAAAVLACSGGEGIDGFGEGHDTELALGDRGPEVAAAHAFFNRIGYFENEALRTEYPAWRPVAGSPPADETVFGEELLAALREFQRHRVSPSRERSTNRRAT